jgi:protein SCO1/2
MGVGKNMKLGISMARAARVSAAMLVVAGLGFSPLGHAADEHAGHDMSGHDMSGHDMSGHAMPGDAAADPHANHKVDTKASVKRSMVNISVAATPMVDQDGKKTTLAKALEGKKPVILAFMYTSCTTVCPVTSQIMSNTQDLLGADLANTRLVSISIDPEYDTPERMLAYSKKFEAKPQWQHYTGTLADSVAVQKAFGAYRGDKMNHVPLFFINGGGKKSWVMLQGFPSAEDVLKEFQRQVKG